MSLKTDRSSGVTDITVLLIPVTIQIITAILIPKYYLAIEKKKYIWIWVFLTESQTE